MDIRNCKRCKRLFNYSDNSKYCPACTEEIEQKFQDAKEFIYRHPGVGIQAVAEEVDVDPSQVKQWVREERLVLSDASDSGIVCETCGVLITTGRFCDSCKSALTNSLSSAITRKEEPKIQIKKSDRDRMRFLDTSK